VISLTTNNLSISKENYLKTILCVKQKKEHIRAIDIAIEMGLSRPSVSHAVHMLEEENYIRLDDKNYIYLTPYGLEQASKIQERYDTFYNFFLSLGIPKDIASFDACRMEHAISEEAFTQLKKYIV
jgi:DtxR family Mn-dependent transcriptional regulator